MNGARNENEKKSFTTFSLKQIGVKDFERIAGEKNVILV